MSFEALSLFPEHEQVKINYEEEKKQIIKILFDAIRTYLNEKIIVNGNRTKCIRINEICKIVPRWSYKFIDELEQLDKFFKKYDTYNPMGDTDNAEKK